MTNKRIVNIRITFVAFVGLMLGILFGFNWYLNRIKTTLAIVMLVGVLMLCVAIIIYAIKTKSYPFDFHRLFYQNFWDLILF